MITAIDAEHGDVPRPDERAAVLYRVVGLDPPLYRRGDVARLAGVEHERSVKWWRAMGFPEVPEDLAAFGDLDIEIVRRLAALSGAGLVDDEDILRLARVLGSSFSRVAEAQVSVIEHLVAALPASAPLANGEPIAPLVAAFDTTVLDLLEDTVLYAWRRQLLAALGRRLQADRDATDAAVGFADLSGFTRLSQRVAPERLAEIVDDFEQIAFDVVSAHGGRAIKLVGDEIMFATASFADAVGIGLDLAQRLREVPDMPEIHCGIAYGPVVAVGGDVFGPVANLAARLTTIARPGTIVIPRAAVEDVAVPDDIEVVPVRRTVRLKGIGDTRIVALRRRDGSRRGRRS
jgi:adenylate cyclase